MTCTLKPNFKDFQSLKNWVPFIKEQGIILEVAFLKISGKAKVGWGKAQEASKNYTQRTIGNGRNLELEEEIIPREKHAYAYWFSSTKLSA